MSETSPRAILHPTDFSEASRPALHLARDLARDHSARLILLHVVDPAVRRSEFGSVNVSLDEMGRRLAEKVATLKELDPALEVEGRVVEGLPTDSILASALGTGADLIVMGSHGRTGLGRVLVGSVAERVARLAPCPVLILKAEPTLAEPDGGGPGGHTGPRFPVVLVPTDYSSRSREALRVASWLVQEGSLVVLVHVVEVVHVATEGYAEALRERLQEWAEPVLGKGTRADYRICEGESATEILGVARQTNASLIILPSHGRTGLDRLLIGSVAEKVFRGASCPVLIVRLSRAVES